MPSIIACDHASISSKRILVRPVMSFRHSADSGSANALQRSVPPVGASASRMRSAWAANALLQVSRTVRDTWSKAFAAHADRILEALAPTGGTDLCNAFALPLSAECLKDITGLTNMRFEDMDAWSQAMIDGIANYSGNKEVEARCHAATSGIDAAIDDMIPVVTKHPNSSILSVLLTAGQPLESVRANIKLAISGGQNEPRDAIAGTVWALLTHPDQLALAREGSATWLD